MRNASGFYGDIGLPRQSLVEYLWQKPKELAHYSRACVDNHTQFPFGKRDEKGELLGGEELEGIAARSDFDLSQHERFSGKPMTVFDEDLRAAWGKLDDAKKTRLSEPLLRSAPEKFDQKRRGRRASRTGREGSP